MKRLCSVSTMLLVCAIAVAAGCSGPATSPGNPLVPDQPAAMTGHNPAESRTHLWGYYDVSIDIISQTATATLNRQAMFTANVVNFINGKPANLGFHINGTSAGADYVDVDIDITITHPFPGLPQYNGYDVRGIFMGDGSATLEYNPDLVYPVLGNDQFMLTDADDGFGGPDGYTRWFNKPEFSMGGKPLFQYTQGNAASPGFAGTATINPCRYYADGLGADEDLWTWLGNHASQHGQFSSGASNTRNYYLRFPNTKGITFGYAIIASWAGAAPELHPANAPEAISVKVADTSDVFYVGGSDKGGNLKLDLSVWDWDSKLSGGVMDYRIFIESTVLSSVHELNPSEMTPIGGGENYSTYHVEIPADNILGSEGNEYWLIVEQQGHDYTNEYGVSNLADTDPVAAFFRYDLKVSSNGPAKPVCDVQVVTPVPYTGWAKLFEFDASGSYDPGGGTLTYSWDFNGDGIFGDSYDAGEPAQPQKMFSSHYVGNVCVQVTNESSAQSECCVPVDITAYPSKNIPLRQGVDGMDIGVDHADGDVLVLYSDGQVWRYLESNYYQTGALFYNTGRPGLNHIDVGENSKSVVGGNNDITISWHASYDPAGVLYTSSQWNSGGLGVFEVMPVTYHTSGYDEYNDHMSVEGWPNIAPYANFHMNRYFDYANFGMGSGWPVFDGSGVGQINHNWMKGLECAKSVSNFYVLEGAPEYRVEEWTMHLYWAYVGVTWGGTQSDTMSGFNDPRDITRDSDENYYILDKLTTGPAIKKFTNTGTPVGSPFGGYGIAGDPLKIEGSDYVGPYDNLLFVLSDGGSQPDMLSIFFKSEIP